MKKVLVLGATGMLGSMITTYLRNTTRYIVGSTIRKSNEKMIWNKLINDIENYTFHLNAKTCHEDLLDILSTFEPDYIINAIGVIKPYCNGNNLPENYTAINVNSLFPYTLSSIVEHNSNAKIIQIATDCVYSGVKGDYVESDPHDALDLYGKSKSLGEVNALNLLNIRCSIIGPEIGRKSSLLEWFLSFKKGSVVEGYGNHYWNGVTTLQFAEYCDLIIKNNLFDYLRSMNSVIHYHPNETVSKYDLLMLFNELFNKEVIIKYTTCQTSVNRTLKSNHIQFEKILMRKAIEDLLLFMDMQKGYSLFSNPRGEEI